ncbi:aminotransferase class III-fold pyridoxal phosphate-dependent enzyme [Streptomyces tirandamycinicus]|uniref:aminotransferase family protein n=1 Tax=Streptomyces tirandamycinicus TaxID=2174846 RepID=UPI00343FCCF8
MDPRTSRRRRSRASADAVTGDVWSLLLPNTVVGGPASPRCMVGGRGALLWDGSGRQYIDATAGLGQCAVGYGHPQLVQAAALQMQRLASFPMFAGSVSEPAISLADRLRAIAPTGLSKTFYTSGGSEGVETALKFARIAHFSTGASERTLILTRKGAYHGTTAGALAVTDIDAFHLGLRGSRQQSVPLSLPHARPLGPDATDMLIDELERTIAAIGGERIAAFIGEPVLGVSGMIPAPPGYWPRLQQVLRRHRILLIADEVATGYGRTGDWFACPQQGIEPDIMVTAKALTSGYVPMGAVLFSDGVIDMLHGTRLPHGFTFGGHAAAAAVALANLDVIEQEHLTDRAAKLGTHLLRQLEPLEELPWVEEVRGTGLMLAVELTPHAAAAARDLPARAAASGVLLRNSPHNICLTPPLVITDAQAQHTIDVITAEVRALGRARSPRAVTVREGGSVRRPG